MKASSRCVCFVFFGFASVFLLNIRVKFNVAFLKCLCFADDLCCLGDTYCHALLKVSSHQHQTGDKM